MIKAMETRLCEARSKELELFCPEEAGESLKSPTPEMNHTDPHEPCLCVHPHFHLIGPPEVLPLA